MIMVTIVFAEQVVGRESERQGKAKAWDAHKRYVCTDQTQISYVFYAVYD